MMEFAYDSSVAKKKTTVYVDESLLRLVRVSAARKGTSDSEVLEDAIRQYFAVDLFEDTWARNADVTEDEAMRLADEAKHATRPPRS